MINKKNLWILSLLLFLLVIVPIARSQNFTLNNSFCENEKAGFDVMGYDFYMLCGHNFEDKYYSGYEEFVNLTGDDVNPIREPSAVPDVKPLNLEPETVQEYFILIKLGINKSKINLNKLKIINYSNLNLNQTKNFTSNISSVDLTSNNSNQTNYFLKEELDNKKTPQTNNQNDLVNLETSQFNTDNQKDSSIQEYFLYLAVGLFILLILYIGIHTLAKIHSEKKEIALARSYVTLLQKQNYTNKQIKQFFIQKGYEESFINKVLKTQDFNP